MPTKIILDCDPGHDDAVAILLAAGNPEIDLLGITTIGGNQTLDKVTANAQAVATVAEIDVPLYRGCARPIVEKPFFAPDIHGDSGLDGVELPEPTVPVCEGHAVDWIIETVLAHPGEVTLVPTGPLTNIAMAARKEPKIVEAVKEVVLMGGAYGNGNITPAAEFNILVDPEAAQIVFNEPWPVTMVGLDLTHQALADARAEDIIRDVNNAKSEFVLGLMAFFREAYRENQGFVDPPVHDPCTIAYLIDPSIVQVEKAPIDVELSGRLTRGMTVVDRRVPAGEDCHTQVATVLDHEKFWQLVAAALR